ncbi:MAG: HIT family protein [Methanospirillum sp.]|uniref:HIT family protein n=1 Tax=Methanospirillum sp. TaxID=45200 RepID=UPI00236B9030|nr:HIT family protein [Methanospirillum sp.]MDD1729305.1 HIT family protein [Methanospirillum sp.]
MGPVTCPFCNYGPDDIVLENEFAYARLDKYPVSPGHLLIIPIRHIPSLFEATTGELTAFWELISRAKQVLNERYSPDGFNIGINDGESAGQTIMHLHIHIIPRYRGDMDDPRGGVRGVIPEKQRY